MDIEKKEKVKNIIKNVWLGISTFLSVCFVVVCVAACSSGSKQQNNNNISDNVNEVVRQENKKYVVYDNEDYSITLNANELNNYVFTNLATYFNENSDINISNVFQNWQSDLSLDGQVETYSYDEFIEYENLTFRTPTLIDSWYLCYLWLDSDLGKIRFVDSDGESVTSGYTYLTLNCTSEYYSIIKSAIELDIEANQPKNIIDNGGIFENMTNSITAFIGSLSSGITAMVGIFYSNGALTIIGLLSVIVVAITLSYFLFRLFIGLIRMRG